MPDLPAVGSTELLTQLSPFVPDALIDSVFPRHKGRGRRALFSAAQLFRVTLLTLLTPVHSFNLLPGCLRDNRQWRKFAFLPNARRLPDVRTLHEFRLKLRPAALREIHQHLLQPLLEPLASYSKTVALIDATDLPASTHPYKKSPTGATRRQEQTWEPAPSRRARAAGSLAIRNTACGSG